MELYPYNFGEGNQEEVTIEDVKDASIDEEKAKNFKGGDYNLT